MITFKEGGKLYHKHMKVTVFLFWDSFNLWHAPDNYFLLSDQDTNWFFGVGGDRIPYFLFDGKRFYQLN